LKNVNTELTSGKYCFFCKRESLNYTYENTALKGAIPNKAMKNDQNPFSALIAVVYNYRLSFAKRME